MMGGGFGGCTINLVKDDLFADFIATAKRKFTERFGHEPKVYPSSSRTAHIKSTDSNHPVT